MKLQDIMNAVVARFQTIKVANGYNTDIGKNVFDYRTKIFQDDELPAISVEDPQESKIDELYGRGNQTDINLKLDLEVILIFKAAGASITEVRQGIADVEKAIGVDITWGGLAYYTDYSGRSIMKDEDEKIITGAKVNIEIDYRTTKWQEN